MQIHLSAWTFFWKEWAKKPQCKGRVGKGSLGQGYLLFWVSDPNLWALVCREDAWWLSFCLFGDSRCLALAFWKARWPHFLQLHFSVNIFHGLCFCSTSKRHRSHSIPQRMQLSVADWPKLSWKLLVFLSIYCSHPKTQAYPISIWNIAHGKEKIPCSTTNTMLARRWYVN